MVFVRAQADRFSIMFRALLSAFILGCAVPLAGQEPAPAPAPPPAEAQPQAEAQPPTDAADPGEVERIDAFDRESFSPGDEALATGWAPRGLTIFGRDLFQRGTSQFQPLQTGPVDPAYRLGPGDQVVVTLSGDVDLTQSLTVTREGTLTVPHVGQLVVQGMTMRQLEDLLYARLGRVFTGVGQGPGATTQFGASLGRLRSNQVLLAGEVERPGAYLVSSVGTAFNALYAARGPNPTGSLRAIQIRRAGELVRTIDVYEYLLRGDSRQDIRLDQGDIVFVPLAGKRVAIRGSVRRSAIFELQAGEDLRDLLGFAGGLDPSASLSRVQIDRILPPQQRQPGVERVLLDVDLRDLARGAAVVLQDHDIVEVFSVQGERRNRVVLDGEVLRPGVYEWTPGTRLWDVIERAEGLTTYAYTPRAHIYRMNLEDGTRFLVQTPLIDDGSGRPIANVSLADLDSVVVYSQAELRNPGHVSIRGMVKRPGQIALAEGMTVRDVILAVGGFIEGADPTGVEVIRVADWSFRTDTIARQQRISLLEESDLASAGRSGLESAVWIPTTEEYVLHNQDFVIVRRAPGYEPTRIVHVRGEVGSPGPYALETRQTRLLDIISMAGGITDEGNPAGLTVVREGLPVGTDLARARRRPNGRHNVALEDGDTILVPKLDGTVRVVGAVTFQAAVVHAPGMSVSDYIAQAGGFTRLSDKGRIVVSYPNGTRAIVRRGLFWRTSPEVTPGSVISVGQRPEPAETDWGDVLTRVVSVVGTMITMIVAVDRLSR
jgi:polysaccharide biosynthesis/export protein